MSEKRPISLRNSDLFLKFELTDSNKEEKHIDDVKYFISKKKTSLGENNHLEALHSFSFLTPLKTSSRGVTNQAFKNLCVLEQSSGKSEINQSFGNNFVQVGLKESKALLSKSEAVQSNALQRTNVKASLWYNSALNQIKSSTRYQSDQLGVQMKHASKLEQSDYSCLPLLVKSFRFFKLYFYSLYFKSFLYKINREISLGISQEFSIVAINLILFSILTIVQRSHYGKNFSANNQKDFYAILCASKLPNLPIWRRMSTNGKQSLWYYPKPKHLVGSFIGQSDISPLSTCKVFTKFVKQPGVVHTLSDNVCTTPVVKDTTLLRRGFLCTHQKEGYHFERVGTKDLFLAKQNFALFPHSKALLSTKHFEGLSLKNKFEIKSNLQHYQILTENKANQNKTFVKKSCAIKPWYCIKASNIKDNHIIATRSTKQAASNNIFYKQQIVAKSQYYRLENINQSCSVHSSELLVSVLGLLPKRSFGTYVQAKASQTKFYFVTPRTNDTIPEKKDSINSKIGTQQNRNKVESSRLVSEMALKRCFYKYGFFLIDSNSTVPSEKKGNLFGVKTLDLLFQQNKVKSSNNNLVGPLLCLEDRGASKVDQSEALLEFRSGKHVRTIPLKKQQKNNESSGKTVNNYINFALYKKQTAFSLEASTNKSRATLKSMFPQFVSSRKNSFVSFMPIELCSGFVVNKTLDQSFNKKKVFNKLSFYKIKNSIKRRCEASKRISSFVLNKTFIYLLPKRSFGIYVKAPILTWSRYNLKKVRIVTFVQATDTVSIFNFKPDILVQNISVSGYQFPKSQTKGDAKHLKEIGSFFKKTINYSVLKKPNLYLNSNAKSNVDPMLLSESSVDLKMQYTQVNLDEIESVKELFEQMGRNYEDYKRQPKDSLPALIISPSLEDDREIEEEGIRIFRKRDLLRKKNLRNPQNSNNIEDTFIDNSLISENSQKQNHDILVKNALRQAQEEIDDIAKKEEKGGEKDKQVIPPLTRLEALYTIRQREKKYEQAKNLKVEKTVACKNEVLRFCTYQSKALVPPFLRAQAKLTFTKKSFPVFEQLFLYSDELNTNSLNAFQFVDIHTPQFLSKLGDEKSNKAGLDITKFTTLNAIHHKPVQTSFVYTPVVQSCDRKHSFFGEISLPAHKLTAQKQKQVFEQKGNPLLKLNAKNTELADNKVTVLDKQSLNINPINFHSTVATVPLSLLSPLAISSKTHNKKLESSPELLSSTFKVGVTKTNIVPPLVWKFENGIMSQPSLYRTSMHTQTEMNQQDSLLKSNLRQKADQGTKVEPFDWVRGPNRIYFYDNLSQNKACQGSTPQIKNTPLGSPVSHRVWQPKRMEPSSFRVLQRSQNTSVVPRISQNDWKNIIEWQLKKHFFEEDKRLWPFNNTNKKFKIKKINLYLPWISITKPPENKVFTHTSKVKPVKGLALNSLVNALRLPESNVNTTSFIKNKVEKGGTLCIPKQHCFSYTRSLNTNKQVNCQTTFYWQFPTRQNLFSINTSRNTQVYRVKQSSVFLNSVQDFIQTLLGKKKSLSLQSKNSKQSFAFVLPEFQKGVVRKVFKESFLFESFSLYSWLFIYTFVSVLMFKQLFKWIYQIGLKNFFIKFLNSDFGRTITSEEFRYSIQNVPLREFYKPKKRLQELFSIDKNKVQLLEIVWFLRNHCQGRHGPRGVLLVGPPGVENISVVQAIAGEAEVPIIVQSLEKIAQDNEPQRQLEQLYMRAHKHAPCVLFLDQLDTIGVRRDQLFTDKTYAHSLNSKVKVNITSPDNVSKKQKSVTFKNKLNVVLRLLTILDGITQSSGVVTVATARDITKLDPALLRPKRFDRRIYLSLPNRQDRIDLFKVQTQNLGHIKEMPWDYLSLQTENMNAADIQSAINYSLFRAVLKKSVHTVDTLEYGIDCVKTLTEKRVSTI